MSKHRNISFGRGPSFREVGRGKHCYVRHAQCGGGTIFRFRTLREANAAARKGMELDHILGAPPKLITAIQQAAKKAKLSGSN